MTWHLDLLHNMETGGYPPGLMFPENTSITNVHNRWSDCYSEGAAILGHSSPSPSAFSSCFCSSCWIWLATMASSACSCALEVWARAKSLSVCQALLRELMTLCFRSEPIRDRLSFSSANTNAYVLPQLSQPGYSRNRNTTQGREDMNKEQYPNVISFGPCGGGSEQASGPGQAKSWAQSGMPLGPTTRTHISFRSKSLGMKIKYNINFNCAWAFESSLLKPQHLSCSKKMIISKRVKRVFRPDGKCWRIPCRWAVDRSLRSSPNLLLWGTCQ